MKIFINNPADFLRRELRYLDEIYNLEYYHEYADGTILISGDMRIDNVEFNGSEKLMITYYQHSVEKFKFYITKPEFTHLEVRL